MLIDFPTFYNFFRVMQTNSTLHFRSRRICLRLGWREAIDINLISKFGFKPKQMRFIVKSYWQYAFYTRCNSKADNRKLLSDLGCSHVAHNKNQLRLRCSLSACSRLEQN